MLQIKEVLVDASWRDFHQVPHYIYQRDPHWIAPLEGDIEKVFSVKGNKAYVLGMAKLWVLFNAAGKGIGRIAAFIDVNHNEKKGTKLGGIGFFECINDDSAAKLLFDTAEQFLIVQGITTIDGPVNYGERDKFWGLLTIGWHPPLYHENYHPAYYQRFFAQNGYLEQEQIFTFGGSLKNVPWERNKRLADVVRARYRVQSRFIRKNDLPTEAKHFVEVYNSAFKEMPHFKPLEFEQVLQAFNAMKPVMDVKVVALAFVDEKPVGFCALMPDINPLLKFSKGRLSWWKLPRFLWNLKFGTGHGVKGVAFGIHEDYQRKGVFAEMVDFLARSNNFRNLKHYRYLGLATIRGGNLLMVKSAAAALNAYVERVHISYRKILDDTPHEPYASSDVSEVPMGEVPPESIYPKI